jgi:hypothetical protein
MVATVTRDISQSSARVWSQKIEAIKSFRAAEKKLDWV